MAQQAGGVVYRRREGATEFLVITTRGDRPSWIFPKGKVEAGESDVDAALREVEEEAGVRGAAVATLDPPQRLRSGGDEVLVRYVLVRALSDGEPEAGREKRWVAAGEALALLSHEDSRRLLLAAQALTEDHGPASVTPDRFHDLLLAHYDHLARVRLATERHAEQRALVLIAVGMVAAVTGTLAPSARAGVLLGALLLGLLTLWQALEARSASQRLEQALAEVRRSLIPDHDPRGAALPDLVGARPGRVGGALGTVVLADSVLAGALLTSLVANGSLAVGIGAGIVAAAALVAVTAWFGPAVSETTRSP